MYIGVVIPSQGAMGTIGLRSPVIGRSHVLEGIGKSSRKTTGNWPRSE